MPEIIDTIFTKISPTRSFSLTEYERFGLVFTKTRVYKFGHCSSLKYPGKTIIGALGNLNSSNALEIEKVQYRNLLD